MDLKPRMFKRRRVLGAGATLVASAAAAVGLPQLRLRSAGAANDRLEFLIVREDEPTDLRPPATPIVLEHAGIAPTADRTFVSTVTDRTDFKKRARVPIRQLPASPPGYKGPVFRVAENLSGAVPMASVTYELPDGSGKHPGSIISFVVKPRGSFPEPFPIRGTALPADYLPSPGYEVRGRDQAVHFWFEGDMLCILMHINYGAKAQVPLSAGPSLIAQSILA